MAFVAGDQYNGPLLGMLFDAVQPVIVDHHPVKHHLHGPSQGDIEKVHNPLIVIGCDFIDYACGFLLGFRYRFLVFGGIRNDGFLHFRVGQHLLHDLFS